MKRCCKCKLEKNTEDFYKCKSNKDGLQKRCKSCHDNFYSKEKIRKIATKQLTSLKSDEERYKKRQEYVKKWHEDNKHKVLEAKKRYSNKNREKVLESKKRYSDKNKDGILSKQKIYRNKEENKEKARIYLNKRRNVLRKEDPLFRLTERIRSIINRSFNYKKPMKTAEILGISFKDFKKHLESNFQPWMTWENRGLYNGDFNYGWDIDHIIPISSAKNENDLIRLNHYTNLQPLCSKINRDIKRDIFYYMKEPP